MLTKKKEGKSQMKLRKIAIIFSFSLFLSACANNSSTSNEQTKFPVTSESTLESNSTSSKAEQSSSTDSITIGNVSLSLHESKQSILEKLDAAGLNYGEAKPDNPAESRYDFYYNVDAWLQVYFLNDECVRLRIINVDFEDSDELPYTVQGLRPGSTYSQMETLYGDSFETHSYSNRIIYTIYRYSINDCIYEFGIQEDSDSIYNIDIYLPNQAPIYEYGEEIPKAN